MLFRSGGAGVLVRGDSCGQLARSTGSTGDFRRGAPPAAPAGPQPCPPRSLPAKPGLSQGTAGSIYQAIDFTNISNVTCTLYGYPGVSLAGGTPVSVIGAPADENPATARVLVILAPGAVANALVRIVQAGHFPASKCGPVTATYLPVYPPHQTPQTLIS